MVAKRALDNYKKLIKNVTQEHTANSSQPMHDLVTHAYAHLPVYMHLAAFAPAFTFSLCESEVPANRRMRIASVVRRHTKKKRNDTKLLLFYSWIFVCSFCNYSYSEWYGDNIANFRQC